MANIKSQKKRVLISEKQRQRNKPRRSALKTYITKVRESVEAGDKDAATEALGAAIKALDSASSKGIIHSNNAANKKSALTRLVNSIT